jgi:hypothetical protein
MEISKQNGQENKIYAMTHSKYIIMLTSEFKAHKSVSQRFFPYATIAQIQDDMLYTSLVSTYRLSTVPLDLHCLPTPRFVLSMRCPKKF